MSASLRLACGRDRLSIRLMIRLRLSELDDECGVKRMLSAVRGRCLVQCEVIDTCSVVMRWTVCDDTGLRDPA